MMHWNDMRRQAGGYLSVADDVVGLRREAGRAASFLARRPRASTMVGEAVPPDRARFIDYLKDAGLVSEPTVKDGVQTVVGAAAGALLWRDHYVLGAIGGASLGRNVPALFDEAVRPEALRNMGQTGAAILGARVVSGSPMLGFVLGWILSGVAVWYWGHA